MVSLAAYPWRDRPLGRVAAEVHRVIREHGTAHVYVGNVFVRVADELDDHDPQYVGCYGRANSVDEIMRALDEALADLRGGR